MTVARRTQLAEEALSHAQDVRLRLAAMKTPQAKQIVGKLDAICKIVGQLATMSHMTAEHTEAIRQAVKDAATRRKADELFVLDFRSSGAEELRGWEALIERTGLTEASLRVRFSKGRGHFDRVINDDICRVTRVSHARRFIDPTPVVATPSGLGSTPRASKSPPTKGYVNKLRGLRG